jgi:hypothetical protein
LKQIGGRLWLVLLASLAIAWSAVAEKARVTGCFTDMRYVQETGDVVGMEVSILYSNGAGPEGEFWVLFQIAEGAPSPPVLVKAKVVGKAVEFTLPASAGTLGTFKGVIGEQALVGTFSGVRERVRLPRGRSYWQ